MQMKIRCPYHEERTPSLIYYPETMTFACLSCEAKGDVTQLLGTLSEINDELTLRGPIKNFDDLREWIWGEMESERNMILDKLQNYVLWYDESDKDSQPYDKAQQARDLGYIQGLECVDERLRSIVKYGE
jgi:hypothetical protein